MTTVRLVGPSQRDYAHELIDTAPQGAVVTIKEPTRSLEQNAKLHAMLQDVSFHCPEGRMYTVHVWKRIFQSYLGYELSFVHGLNGEPVPVEAKTSGMSVKAMSDLIEVIYAYGTQHGVVWRETDKGGWND